MRLIVFLIASISACGATVTASGNGLWASGGTWVGGVAPASGDTAVIPDGITVTAAATATVAIVNANCTGVVAVTGGTFTATTFNYTGTTCNSTALTAAAGTTLHIGTFAPASGNGLRGVQTNGTSGSHVTVGPSASYATYALGSLVATYTDFTNIGDATHNGWTVLYEYSGSHLSQWNVQNSTFTGCGPIASGNSIGPDDNGTFRHVNNVHSSSAQSEVFHAWINISGTYSSGERSILGNVFDVAMTRSSFYLPGFIVRGNYFTDATLTGGTIAWASVSDNFYRFSDWWGSTASAMGILADLYDSYLFVDSDWGNPKPIIMSSSLVSNLRGVIFGQAGTATGPPGTNDSGELWFSFNPTVAGTQYGMYSSIILPNMAGHGSLEMGSITYAFANLVGVAEHNTWFGGHTSITTPNIAGFPAMQLGEGGNGSAGMVGSFRSNILWNPQLVGYKSSFFKLADISYSATPVTNYCLPANCDYNTGWGFTATDVAHPQYTNQAKGYAAKFSSPPGVHDKDVNPNFVDYQRNVELFDSKYLGNSPAAWSGGASYSVGNFVSSTDASVYWGLSVNYRYINVGACAGTNPKPGVGTNWRDCWEWASLYRLRQSVAAQTTYTDYSLGVYSQDIITLLVRWIRAGYAPQNVALAGAGHDGLDIGAIAYVSAGAPAPSSGGTVVRGVTVKGVVIR